ncbi:MAG: FAD-dependent oxidoreductase [Proteobacteria bacterium]|nr:FAD-dependent oxidoreductase [Pseudomonadota bacterium]
MSGKIGVYVCHCGINIAGKVRVEEVAEYAGTLNNVVVARDYKFMCSDPGQELIEKDIRELDLTRVVVASCSPRLHEKTFQGACQRAGLNPYFFQQASIREQVSWVTEDPDAATRKAKTLAAAAVNRTNFHRSLVSREVPVHPDVLIVGAGITGMQASLDIAAAGNKVFLVERQSTIGGHMLQFDKTFPTLDCAACIGTPKMVSVGQNSNIELLTYSEVEDVSGYIGNFKVKVHRNARYVKEGICTGCGECATVCPVSSPSEWDEGLVDRRAAFRAFPQAVPIAYVIDKKDRAPCVSTCPAGLKVQGYVQMAKEGKFKESLEIIMKDLPLPSVLGRICPHECENECRRCKVDEPVAIRDLKRLAADQFDPRDIEIDCLPRREEKVAIVGSGPAGLSAAFQLARKGILSTIYEALPRAGGMLRVGIPDHRLPGDILDRDIEVITNLGVEIKTDTPLGPDLTVDDLMADYQAVYLAFGAHTGIKLGVAGEEADGVRQGVDFLRELNLTGKTEVGKRVGIIGGGNVAIDVARSAVRLGAEAVSIIYRRTRKEMPAWEEEIQAAEDEGTKITYLAAPEEVVIKDGKVAGITCIRMELGEPDASGRRRPVPVAGSQYVIELDQLIPAIGQRPDLSAIEGVSNLEISRWHTIEVDQTTYATGKVGVFAGGDMETGPDIAIGAIAAGTEAAESIVRYLDGSDMAEDREPLANRKKVDGDYKPIADDEPELARVKMPELSIQNREGNFKEVELGYGIVEGQAEAGRCLNCGECSECMECVKVCEAKAIDHEMAAEDREIDVGSIIVATGFDLMDPTPMTQFGYGKYPNVYTSLEFERLNNATGPTMGQILMRDQTGAFTRPPESVAIIHCVGSRDENYHDYCSRVCCMYALKYGHLIHDKVGPNTRIYDFYIDMRCFGKGYEEFYRRCQDEGISFIRGKPAEISNLAMSAEEEGKLVVIGEDTLADMSYRLPVDMVVLCAAIQSRSDADEVARTFGISQGADGFFLEEHPKLGPLNTPTDGVFLAGVCQGPKDVPDTVSQASGAAVKSLQLATAGKVQVSSTISWIDPNICAGCQTCIGLCAYSAIEFNERSAVSEVNEALCKGCGSCSGFCPSGAAQIRHFNEKQIFAELDGVMDAIAEVGI